VIRGIDEVGDLAEVRGGSTITQQAAKNLFLWQGRSFVRKALEFPLALWIDLVLPKRRLMEIYLNIVAWGPNGEFGIAAAARRDFNKAPRDLTAQEAALLASTLPSPGRRDPRAPKPTLRRLAGVYQGRMAAWTGLNACVRTRNAPPSL
jgi:monofunctional biosynthetic peptidoglycan transglycosylase